MLLVLEELAVTEVFHVIFVCFKYFLDDVATDLSLFLVLWLATTYEEIYDGMLKTADSIGRFMKTVIVHQVVHKFVIKKECLAITIRTAFETRLVLSERAE